MSELQETIIEEVRQIQDQQLLRSILEMIMQNSKGPNLSEESEILREIDAARDQYRNGKVKSHRKVMEETREWLLSK